MDAGFDVGCSLKAGGVEDGGIEEGRLGEA